MYVENTVNIDAPQDIVYVLPSTCVSAIVIEPHRVQADPQQRQRVLQLLFLD